MADTGAPNRPTTGQEPEGELAIYLPALRERAEATRARYPGRWFQLAEDFEDPARPDVGNVWQKVSEDRATAVVHDTSRIAAEYLESFQPEVAIELLDRIEELEALVFRLNETIGEGPS